MKNRDIDNVLVNHWREGTDQHEQWIDITKTELYQIIASALEKEKVDMEKESVRGVVYSLSLGQNSGIAIAISVVAKLMGVGE